MEYGEHWAGWDMSWDDSDICPVCFWFWRDNMKSGPQEPDSWKCAFWGKEGAD